MSSQIPNGSVVTVVQGIVTDPEKIPIPGATVIINPPGQPVALSVATTTDDDGRYYFEAGGAANLDVFTTDPNGPRPYPITAGQADFVTGVQQVSIEWGQIVTMDFVLATKNCTPHPFTVTGTVTGFFGPQSDSTIGNVADAKISVFTTTAQSPPLPTVTGLSQSNGTYSVGSVNPGSYRGGYSVLVEAANFLPEQVEFSQPTGATMELNVELAHVSFKCQCRRSNQAR
jgi:hypothetical protein